MALVRCSTCKQSVSPRAETCPGCGKPLKGRNQASGCGTLVIIWIAAVYLFSDPRDATERSPSARPPAPILSDSDCRRVLKCWAGKHAEQASDACQERLAQLIGDTQSGIELAPQANLWAYAWEDRTRGTLRYSGDGSSLRIDSDATKNAALECVYDPLAGQALDVFITAGNLGNQDRK